MADWTDYLKKAVVYTNPLTQGTAIGSAIYNDVTGGNLIGDITGAAQSPGYSTAAEGAKAAQAYLQQLSQTAWDRQMQGLQGALGSFAGYDALSAQMNPRHGGPPAGGGGGMPGAAGPGGPPPGAPPALPPPSGAPTTGYRPPLGAPRTPLTPPGAPPALPPPGTPSTGYAPPPGAARTPLNPPPALPPPGGGFAPAALPPPGSPLALPPPGSPIGAPPSLAPPSIMDQLAAMMTARSGGGHF